MFLGFITTIEAIKIVDEWRVIRGRKPAWRDDQKGDQRKSVLTSNVKQLRRWDLVPATFKSDTSMLFWDEDALREVLRTRRGSGNWTCGDGRRGGRKPSGDASGDVSASQDGG